MTLNNIITTSIKGVMRLVYWAYQSCKEKLMLSRFCDSMPANTTEECIKIGESLSIKCLKRFCSSSFLLFVSDNDQQL